MSNLEYYKEIIRKHSDELNFTIADKGEYTVIDYILPNPKTFPEVNENDSQQVQKEKLDIRNCRGIIFCNVTGKIIRLPLEKFFNLNERQSITLEKLLHLDGDILEKLDGSMIASFRTHSGRLIHGSKMGETPISPFVDAFILDNPHYTKFIEFILNQNKTPIFELLDSANNKIVLDYGSKVRLVLLGVRDMTTGEYFPYGFLQHLAHQFNIELVQRITEKAFSEEFVNFAVKQEGVEGYVVRLSNGVAVKVKNEWYSLVHHAKSSLSGERHVVQLIINGQTDDLKPLLEPENRTLIDSFEEEVYSAIADTCLGIAKVLQTIKDDNLDRKTYSLGLMKTVPEFYQGFIWNNWGTEIYQEKIMQDLKNYILKYCPMGKSKYEKNVRKPLFDLYNVTRWRPLMFFESEIEVDDDNSEHNEA